jgi:hypothetical protein
MTVSLYQLPTVSALPAALHRPSRQPAVAAVATATRSLLAPHVVVFVAFLTLFISTATSGLILHHDIASLHAETACNYDFNSSQQLSGSFSSPLYPSFYPSYVTCRYTFHGRRLESVQLQFNDVDLFFPDGYPTHPYDCDDDVATISVGEFDDAEHQLMTEIAVYCGSRLPPLLMGKAGHSLVVTFNSRETGTARGFTANFSFVTDFGVRGGVQDSKAGCTFEFRKNVVGPNSSFTSPNYPGIYPRNTECHYLFYGDAEDQIHIVFSHFDVDGILPKCDEETSSDHVELSNFNVNLTDRKMSRLCGYNVRAESPHYVISDGNFFRVTFRSNEIYGATGFEGRLRFEELKDPQPRPLTSHNLSSKSSNCSRLPSTLVALGAALVAVVFTLM